MDRSQGKTRHVSRLKKEMLELRLQNNPFSSPPSSTGSHDTVSTTTAEDYPDDISAFSFSPDGEGTRRAGEDDNKASKKASAVSKTNNTLSGRVRTTINTSVLGHQFPEWSGLANKQNATLSKSITTGSLLMVEEAKENMPPTNGHSKGEMNEQNFSNYVSRHRRMQSDMQARVEDESESSTVLSATPSRPIAATRRSKFAQDGTRNWSPVPARHDPDHSLSDIAEKIRKHKTVSTDEVDIADKIRKHKTTKDDAAPTANLSLNPTSHSFFLPSFRYLPDWTSGALKLSTKDGRPVFVKSSKARHRLGQTSTHGSLEGVQIPEEDEQIIVSLDKLQEEVRELHDHDAMLQREADNQQVIINQLQHELDKCRERRGPDSAIGSDSDRSFNRRLDEQKHELERQVNQLKQRLEEAHREMGVRDINAEAVAAERDEAMHRASAAREKANKLLFELETVQKDYDASLNYRQHKDALTMENDSLRAANSTLRKGHEEAMQTRETLASQHDKLKKDFAALQRELAAVREELADLRQQHQGLREEKRHISQDHASLERNNETYFLENKRLHEEMASRDRMIAARDRNIAELQKTITNYDAMVESLNNRSVNMNQHDRHDELEDELDRLRGLLQRRAAELKERDGRIRDLKGENVRLSRELQDMQDLRTMDENTQECIRLEEVMFSQNERRESALRKMRQVTKLMAEIQLDMTSHSVKSNKSTRIIDPRAQGGAEQAVEASAKSRAANAASTEMADSEAPEFTDILREQNSQVQEIYRSLRQRQQHHEDEDEDEEEEEEEEEAGQTDYSLPPVRSPLKTVGSGSPQKEKAPPAGILKKPRRFAKEPEDTGRVSVKSGHSAVSARTVESVDHTSTSMLRRHHRSSKKVADSRARSESRVRSRAEDVDETTDHEENMTSAFIIPDITLRSEKKDNTATATGKAGPSLSKDARRVLDGVCKHKSGNCFMCARMWAYGETKRVVSTTTRMTLAVEEARTAKKRVCVARPVPVTDRDDYNEEEDRTERPAMAPGDALAAVMQEVQDEMAHLAMDLKQKQDVYFGADKATGDRHHKGLSAEIQRLQRTVEEKRVLFYRLNDVLEGQKQAGQVMEADELDLTVADILNVHVAQATATGGSRDGSWNGFD